MRSLAQAIADHCGAGAAAGSLHLASTLSRGLWAASPSTSLSPFTSLGMPCQCPRSLPPIATHWP